jgi:hypothetical protein
MSVRDQLIRLCHGQVIVVEQPIEPLGGKLPAVSVGDGLHSLRKLLLQSAWQIQAVFAQKEIRDAALAGLRVDADDRLVASPEVIRIDRKIGDVPHVRLGALLRVHPFLDAS